MTKRSLDLVQLQLVETIEDLGFGSIKQIPIRDGRAWVDERVYAAIRGCSVKVLQNERRLNIGCPFRRIKGTMIRYKLEDITAFLKSQPGGGGAEKPGNQPRRGAGRPRRSLT